MNCVSSLQEIMDFVFPPRCLACDALLLEILDDSLVSRYFCPICIEGLMPLSASRCTVCAEPFETTQPGHICGTCLRHPPQFNTITAGYLYGGPVAKALQRYKYRDSAHMSAPLGDLMVAHMDSSKKIDCVIPVPLHPKRQAVRGYNQAALLAKACAKQRNIPLKTNLLHRLHHVDSQVGKSKKERIGGLKNAFGLRDKKGSLRHKRILLVDDVVTTTATVRAASKVLRKDGCAKSVDILCLARSV